MDEAPRRERKVTRAGSLTQSLSGERFRILTFGWRVSALKGTAIADVPIASVASTTASYCPSTSLPIRLAPSHSSVRVPVSTAQRMGSRPAPP